MSKLAIFDIDGTLVNSSYDQERKLFKDRLGAETSSKIHMGSLLDLYEERHYRYEKHTLIKFMEEQLHCKIPADLIDEWINIGQYDKTDYCDGVFELLDHLKAKDYDLGICSNWFTECQVKRLKKFKLYDYFDIIRGGDYVLKPNPEAYKQFLVNHRLEDCVMIGDNYDKDYLGPLSIGMKSIHIDHHDENKSLRKVREILR